MTQTINRMYKSNETARDVVALLRKDRIWDGNIYLVGPRDGQSEDDITAAIMKSYVPRAEARLYAKSVRSGSSLVTVHAPFGWAVAAAHILDGFGPIESGVSEPDRVHRGWDEAAPLSSAFRVSILIDNPAPMSALWNVRPLTSGHASLSETVGLPELVDSKESLSTTIGLPMLSRRATPLSSLFHIPLLWRR